MQFFECLVILLISGNFGRGLPRIYDVNDDFVDKIMNDDASTENNNDDDDVTADNYDDNLSTGNHYDDVHLGGGMNNIYAESYDYQSEEVVDFEDYNYNDDGITFAVKYYFTFIDTDTFYFHFIYLYF